MCKRYFASEIIKSRSPSRKKTRRVKLAFRRFRLVSEFQCRVLNQTGFSKDFVPINRSDHEKKNIPKNYFNSIYVVLTNENIPS